MFQAARGNSVNNKQETVCLQMVSHLTIAYICNVYVWEVFKVKLEK